MLEAQRMIANQAALVERILRPHLQLMQAYARDVEAWHGAQFAGMQTIILEAQKAAEESVNMFRTLGQLRKRSAKFAAMLEGLKWPPPGHLPCRVIDKIVETYEAGQLADADVEDIFIRAYSPALLSEIEGRWRSYIWLGERLEVLQEAMENYRNLNYHSVICLLMLQIEGILGANLGRKPIPENDAELIFGESTFGEVMKKYYVEVIHENFNGWKDPSAPIPHFSRHVVAHGRAATYGKRPYALKLLLFMDYLLSSVDAYNAKKQ